MVSESVADSTESSFSDDVIKSDLPVLVDFWAPWCAPCRKLEPVLESLATKYTSKIKIVKVNIDTERSLATQYKVKSIPNQQFFKDGTLVNQIVGFAPDELETAIIEIIG